MDEKCRLCGAEAPSSSVFDSSEDEIQYIQKIKECLPVLIYRTDPLSKQICSECVSKLNATYLFQKKVKHFITSSVVDLEKQKNDSNIENYLIAVEKESKELKTHPWDDYRINDTKNQEVLTNGNISLKILSPSCINNLIDVKLSQSKQDEQEPIKTIKIEQPKSLLQCALQSVNSRIHPEKEPSENSEDETEPCIKNDVSTLNMSENRKRKLQESTYFLESLLRSPDLGIKRIKLKLDDPNESSIQISIGEDLQTSPLSVRVKNAKLACKRCPLKFTDITKLALHDKKHLKIKLGFRIDNRKWSGNENDMNMRNAWIQSLKANETESVEEETIDTEVQSIESNIEQNSEESVPAEDVKMEEFKDLSKENENTEEEMKEGDLDQLLRPADLLETSLLIPGTPTVRGAIPDSVRLYNGVLLHNLPKHQRYQIYRTVLVKGVKRKQCPVCKGCFKNPWAVDYHLVVRRCCVRICEFCQLYFLKTDQSYFEHLETHKDEPEYERVMNAEKSKRIKFTKKNKVTQEKVLPVKVRNMVPRFIKKEPKEETIDVETVQIPEASKPTRVQYCRGCYKLFSDSLQYVLHLNQCTVDNTSDFNTEYSPEPKNVTMVTKVVKISKSAKTKKAFKPMMVSKMEPAKVKKTQVCEICNIQFANVQARNSHMRVHLLSRSPITKPKLAPVTVKVQVPEPRMVDENLARLAQNPNITIRPSGSSGDHFSPNKIMAPTTSYKMTSPSAPPKMANYSCLPCGMNFATKSLLYVHKKSNCEVETISIKKKVRCVPCNKRFASKAALYIHKKQCNKVKLFECPFCKRKFGTESLYTSHILYNHPE